MPLFALRWPMALFALCLTMLAASFNAAAQRTSLPDRVDRVVVLQHQTLNLLVQLDAADDVVGLLSSWKKQLGPDFARFAPRLATLPMPGDLTQVNIESLLALRPQVVFVANYAPPDMIKQIESAGIAVIAVSLRQDAPGQQDKLNPQIVDEEHAYNQGLRQGIQLIAEVVNRQQQGEALIHYAFSARAETDARLKDIADSQRIRVYMANPELTTYGSGKYTGLMMRHAGAINVAAASISGYKQVSMEQVLSWNPQVIFVQDRYPDVVKQLYADPAWAAIDAVKHRRVYLMPEYAKAWGYPMPEALAIGELWMAKKLYPQHFSDIDINQRANAYYQRFYRLAWHPRADAQ